ncbi:MAG: NADH:flavin oxidoreductase [Anaerolineaceae bacterium]|nr:NADH:flavin oxidoreductase [Anaerolineaceae bacterium]
MSKLFTEGKIGNLTINNRLVRSATAECMADETGKPTTNLHAYLKKLAEGGVGLIITGHMYVHPGGKAHPEMTGIYSDDITPDLAELTKTIHDAGGKVVAQINHGGMNCARKSVADPVTASDFEADFIKRPARAMTPAEVEEVIDAFGQAARRAKEAGFDGVQIHAAHGYLNSQFLSPLINKRTDRWGGSAEKRMNLLRDISQAIRDQVGPDYLVMIKLGLEDGVEGGLPLDEGLKVVAKLTGMGIDAVEISGGIGGGEIQIIRKGVKVSQNEAYFLDWAEKARQLTKLPILLVGGLRSKAAMEEVLTDGYADFISLCRPLICEPDLPVRMRDGLQNSSICISANNCWAKEPGVGIACKCPIDRVR